MFFVGGLAGLSRSMCGAGFGGALFRSISGAEFDGSGELSESVRDFGLCSLDSCCHQWPDSDNLRIGDKFSQSATFASRFSDGSRREDDVAVPSLAASTTPTRTSCSCKNTGAASAKSITESVRKIRASVLYNRIFVGNVRFDSIRRG